MGAAVKKEDLRREIRHPLAGDWTGSLISAQTGHLLPCTATNVSKSGLRIVLSVELKPGLELILRSEQQEEYRLTVIWCQREPTREGYFSCGLKTQDGEADLVALFAGQGWT